MLYAVVSYINQGLPPPIDVKLFQNSPEGVVVPEITIPRVTPCVDIVIPSYQNLLLVD